MGENYSTLIRSSLAPKACVELVLTRLDFPFRDPYVCVFRVTYACTTLGCLFSPGLFLSSRVTGACPVTTTLIMRVNVRTATCFDENNTAVTSAV